MKDIYKAAFKSRKVKKNITETSVDMPIVVKVPIQRIEIPAAKKEDKAYPEVQSVKVVNPQKAPDVQKVEITNPTPQKEVIIPDTVRISNIEEFAKHIKIPDIIKISNPTPQLDIPISKGNKPGEADPERYVPVRMTNGKNFLNGMGDQFVAAAKSAFPYVNKTTGKPQAATVDDAGIVQTTTGNATVSTTSGTPLDVTIRNIPTIQTVNIQNMPTISVTTASGQPGLNFPTVQTVAVQSMPTLSVTTASGQPGLNFPTTQTVNVQNIPYVQVQPGITTAVSGNLTVTSVSGTDHTIIDNFPNVQSVEVLNPSQFPTHTLASGTDNTNIANFPTIQTVRDTSVTISGSQHTLIDNFPNVMTIQPQGVTTIAPQAGATTAVSGIVTTLSGFHATIDNFPTIQKVSIADSPNITTASGSKTDIQNFPTVQTVNVSNMPNATSVSGTNFNVFVDNIPTVRMVQVVPGVTTAVSGNITATTASGQPGLNFPTVQTVVVANPSSATVTTTSGTPLDTFVRNFPTVQTVAVQSMPTISVTTASGQPGLNFPTVQTVQPQGITTIVPQAALTLAVSGTVTTASGFHTTIDNFPTIQKVSVADLPSVTIGNNITTASGSVVDVKNFPTIQTVNVQNIPTVTVTSASGTQTVHVDNLPTTQMVTSVSGSEHAVIDNFPNVLTVQPQGVTTISGQAGVTLAVSGTITTTSGFHATIDNFPTIQTVNIQNMPSITSTTASGLPGLNFPTVQTVVVANPSAATVTTSSGSPLDVTVRNFPTIYTVQPQGVTTISGQAGVTLAVSGTVTSASGTLNNTITNFPTVQTVNVQNSIGAGVVGATIPATAIYLGGQKSGNLTGLALDGGGNLLVNSVAALPAGANSIGTVTSPTAGNFMNVSYSTTETVYSGTQPSIIQFAPIIASAAGVTTVISGVANKVIKVLDWDIMSNGTVNIDWRSISSQKQLTGLYYLIVNTGLVKPHSDKGVIQTEKGEGLGLELSTSIAVGGSLTYITV